jgi:hypothetical protein
VLFALYAVSMFAFLNNFIINFASFPTYIKVAQSVCSLFVSTMFSVACLLCGCVIIVSLYPFSYEICLFSLFLLSCVSGCL